MNKLEFLEDLYKVSCLDKASINLRTSSEERQAYKTADNLFKEKYGNSYHFYRVYSFTNEALQKIFEMFDLKDRKALVISGSGDPAIECLAQGITDITMLDINPFSEIYTNAKLSGFDFDESLYEGMFRAEKVSPQLVSTVKNYTGIDASGLEILTNHQLLDNLFSTRNHKVENVKLTSILDKYETIRTNLKIAKLKSRVGNVLNSLDYYQGQGFDFIYFSNINAGYSKEMWTAFVESITENLLNKDGIFILGHDETYSSLKYKIEQEFIKFSIIVSSDFESVESNFSYIRK